MDRGAWQAVVHRITKSWTRLKPLSMHTHMCSIMSYINSDYFISYFLIWVPFIYLLIFLFWLAGAKTFHTMLNKNGKSGHPSLIPNLRRNAFSFSLLSMMLSVE